MLGRSVILICSLFSLLSNPPHLLDSSPPTPLLPPPPPSPSATSSPNPPSQTSTPPASSRPSPSLTSQGQEGYPLRRSRRLHPTCSQKHLPGFVEKAGELKAKGVDTIACISINDAFIMKAWKDNLSIGDEVLMLSDENADFTRALGVLLDLTDKPVGLGVRSRRYAQLAVDAVVKVLNFEGGGAFTFSSAEDMLKAL